ncbi:LysR substrate-binding domain-containing protein [Mesorhizobium zhangyense]|uniref:LysR substrate-binding domain-containing protein n=1 Tax=Mesorhizobium zhangyense TaxID=1776730 RepID=UPI0024835737|nr:LysR substrate-binding domain-containing protein [Mesorhizobium zhangyense]
MRNPRREIKSLAALFAFEAAGRHLSVTAAAREMGVSQSAVSKQIAALEAEVGAPLFTRHHREIRLTWKGEELLKVTSASLSAMASMLRNIRERSIDKVVTIGASMTLSHFWLLPKLPQFRDSHPEVTIRVVSQETPVPLEDGAVDMVIRFGSGDWTDGRVQPLMKSRIQVMATRRLIERYGPIETAGDVLRLPLIAYDAIDESWTSWNDWAHEAGIDAVAPPALSFNRYWDALQAAAAGQGALLVWSGLTGGIEENGILVPLPGPALIPRGDFYLVTSDLVSKSTRHATLRDWLLEQAHN